MLIIIEYQIVKPKIFIIFAKNFALERNELFQEVYKNYILDRNLNDITELVFERLLKIYPALLVTATDNFVDLAEVDTLSHIAANGTNIPTELFSRELKNLYLNQGHWRNLFTKLIKENCSSEEDKHEILMNMIYAAAASTGSIVKNILLSEYRPQKFNLHDIQSLEQIDPTKQFFSSDEKQKILQIAEELQLFPNEIIKNKIYQLFA